MHGVREVGPADLRVLHLLGEDDVRLVSHQARDVVVLGRTHGRVNEAHGVLTDVFRVQSASEELVVRAVHRVAALERHDILTRGQPRAHLRGRRARKRSLRNVQTLNLSTDVILATLHGDHRHAGMLDGARPVAHLRLFRLIRLPLRLHRQHADILALILEQHSVARLGVLAIRVQHDRQPEQQLAPPQPHRLHAVFVLVLVHESSQRREPPRREQLRVARVSIRQLERPRARRDRPRLRPVVLEHQIHQRAAVRRDQSIARPRRERPRARRQRRARRRRRGRARRRRRTLNERPARRRPELRARRRRRRASRRARRAAHRIAREPSARRHRRRRAPSSCVARRRAIRSIASRRRNTRASVGPLNPKKTPGRAGGKKKRRRRATDGTGRRRRRTGSMRRHARGAMRALARCAPRRRATRDAETRETRGRTHARVERMNQSKLHSIVAADARTNDERTIDEGRERRRECAKTG